MNLETQVCSLELAKRLKKLGVKQESLWWWVSYEGKWTLDYYKETPKGLLNTYPEKVYSAFTVAELGEMLPKEYSRSQKYKDYWFVWSAKYSASQKATTEANARAKMLIYLKEKGLIK